MSTRIAFEWNSLPVSYVKCHLHGTDTYVLGTNDKRFSVEFGTRDYGTRTSYVAARGGVSCHAAEHFRSKAKKNPPES